MMASVLLLLSISPLLAYQPPLVARPRASALRRTMPPLLQQSPYEKEQARKAEAKAAIEKAEEKLETLNEVGGRSGSPSSWADLGLPTEPVPEVEIPAILQFAPAVLGVFSVLLFLLNGVGLFGEGPDLDALAEEWSKL